MQEAHGGCNRPGDAPRVADTQLPPSTQRGGVIRLRLGAKGKGAHPGDPHALIGGGGHPIPLAKARPDGRGLSHQTRGSHPGHPDDLNGSR